MVTSATIDTGPSLPRSTLRALVEISRTGLTSILLHPLRSAVTVVCLVAVLLPYLAGLGISRGIQDEVEAAARYGPDLYVTAEQFGRPAPLPLSAAEDVRKIPGVETAVPR